MLRLVKQIDHKLNSIGNLAEMTFEKIDLLERKILQIENRLTSLEDE